MGAKEKNPSGVSESIPMSHTIQFSAFLHVARRGEGQLPSCSLLGVAMKRQDTIRPGWSKIAESELRYEGLLMFLFFFLRYESVFSLLYGDFHSLRSLALESRPGIIVRTSQPRNEGLVSLSNGSTRNV